MIAEASFYCADNRDLQRRVAALRLELNEQQRAAITAQTALEQERRLHGELRHKHARLRRRHARLRVQHKSLLSAHNSLANRAQSIQNELTAVRRAPSLTAVPGAV